jgi:phage tail tape-measure protein
MVEGGEVVVVYCSETERGVGEVRGGSEDSDVVSIADDMDTGKRGRECGDVEVE